MARMKPEAKKDHFPAGKSPPGAGTEKGDFKRSLTAAAFPLIA